RPAHGWRNQRLRRNARQDHSNDRCLMSDQTPAVALKPDRPESPSAAASAGTGPVSLFEAIVRHRLIWPLVALALVLAADALISPGFFSVRIVQGRLFGNLIDIFYRGMPPAMIALGMAAVISTKGIDLSVGSIVAITGAVIAWRIHEGDPHFVILLAALCVGLACGLWNGLLVTVLDIQPIIATLILMVAGRGIGLMINLLYGGTNPSFTSPLLQGLSVGHLSLIPTRLVIGAVMIFLMWLLVRRTAFGLFLESVGSNAESARLAGVSARLIKLSAYLL